MSSSSLTHTLINCEIGALQETKSGHDTYRDAAEGPLSTNIRAKSKVDEQASLLDHLQESKHIVTACTKKTVSTEDI